jgi:predicted ArsR family transcriptional regulator
VSQDVLMVDSAERAGVLLKPMRIALLKEMTAPRSCSQLAASFGTTPQQVYYHVKTLERAGFVERCGQRSVNGIAEGFYRASAQSYWFSPRLVQALGGRRAVRDQTSLGVLAAHAEQLLEDVGHLAHRSAAGEPVSSLSLGVDIEIPESRRMEFQEELRGTFEAIARKYVSAPTSTPTRSEASTAFRLTLACYPQVMEEAV